MDKVCINGREYILEPSRRTASARILPEDILQAVDRYLAAAELHVAALESGQESNAAIWTSDWLTPSISGPVRGLSEDGNKYVYFSSMAGVLKKLRNQGYVSKDDDSVLRCLNAPSELRLNPDHGYGE